MSKPDHLARDSARLARLLYKLLNGETRTSFRQMYVTVCYLEQ